MWRAAWTFVVLGSTSLIAWSLLALYWNDVTLPAFCSAGSSLPLMTSFDLVLVFNSPMQLASGWALMLAAMMPPLIIMPLRHVRERSFARRRARAMSLLVAGYAMIWMIAGIVLQPVALVAEWAVPNWQARLAFATMAAMLWQVSPAKQWCLNRCHRRPQLAAFGTAADRDAFNFGFAHGASCVGACWALMLLPLFVRQGHVLAMFAVMLFAFAERLECAAPLAWRWRGPGRALRIIAAQSRMRLARRATL
jgi:predicted metal-binding membrane protein